VTQEQDAEVVRAGGTVPAAFKGDGFNCVHCAAYSEHHWEQLSWFESTGRVESPVWQARCSRCGVRSYWLKTGAGDGRIIFPQASAAPPAHPEMPADVQADYREAAAIADRSPRGAGALLRLALQKLMPHLGGNGKNLDQDIGKLVADGLDLRVQQALDALRVIGNNAVHPGEIDLTEDPEKVATLFGLLNYIVEERITRPRQLEELYQSLPEGALKAIERRDQSECPQPPL